ncbi:MAG: GNAT family N-acetyltransferase [Chloroflexi bacterium OHK40]
MELAPRPYTDDDLPRVQAALASWRHAAGPCGYCHIGDLPHRIYAELREHHPAQERVRIWEEGSAIVAIAIHGRFNAAFDLFTCPPYRGSAQERTMLELAATITGRLIAASGQSEVITDVHGCDTTRQRQLTHLGFAPYRIWDHLTERSLDAPLPEAPLPAGFTVRPATLDDAGGLAAARNSAFGSDWTAERYRDAVMRRPGYRPDHELVVVAPDGQVAAFTVMWLDELNRVGLLEPVGTHRAFQRRGLARALLVAALGELHRRGMASATIAHDATNLPAVALYQSLGFRTRDETLGFRRTLEVG